MKVTVLLAIALTIAFATAALPRPQEADGTSKLILPPRISTSTGSVSGTGTLLGATHTNETPTFDPLAQTLSSSSTALLEVELQRLMRTWKLGRSS
jgi:hypothetical protein